MWNDARPELDTIMSAVFTCNAEGKECPSDLTSRGKTGLTVEQETPVVQQGNEMKEQFKTKLLATCMMIHAKYHTETDSSTSSLGLCRVT